MGLLGWIATGLVGLAGVLIFSAALSNVGVIRDAASNRVLISQIPAAGDATLTSLKDYYRDKSHCPQSRYEQRLLNKWPRLPAIVAGIKFALSQDQGWRNDKKTREVRRKMLAVLEDPSFKLEYSEKTDGLTEAQLLDQTAKGGNFASGQPVDANTVRLGPTSDFNSYTGMKDPQDPSKILVKREDTGLAISIMHELYHITQLRENPSLTHLHSDSATEKPAYSFSGSEPPLALIKAGDAFYQAAAGAACPQQQAALPPEARPASGSVSQSLVLVIDASGSMAGQKLADAKRAATDMLTSKVSAGSEVALAVYTDCGQISWEPFTTQPKALIPKVEAIRASGNTDMTGAIRVAELHLTNGDAKGASGVVVVLSDGDDNCHGNPVDATRSLVSKKMPSAFLPTFSPTAAAWVHASGPPLMDSSAKGEITLHAVGFQVSSAAERQLKEMSVAGHGGYYPAANYSDLSQALGNAILAGLEPEHDPVPATPLALKDKELNVTGGLLPAGAGAALAAAAAIYAGASTLRRRPQPAMAYLSPMIVSPPANTCAACGGGLGPGNRFCVRCGAATQPAGAVSTCVRCGATVDPGSRYCFNCGARLTSAA